jgi:hypothetical protein
MRFLSCVLGPSFVGSPVLALGGIPLSSLITGDLVLAERRATRPGDRCVVVLYNIAHGQSQQTASRGRGPIHQLRGVPHCHEKWEEVGGVLELELPIITTVPRAIPSSPLQGAARQQSPLANRWPLAQQAVKLVCLILELFLLSPGREPLEQPSY